MNDEVICSKIGQHKGLKTTFIGIIVSGILTIVKLVGGILGHSYALIADAIESGTDILSSILLWFGLKWSTKPIDDNHPYGHGKIEALISLGIALIMLVAGLIIIRTNIVNILEPHKAPPAIFTLVILVVVVLTKELLYRYVLKIGTELNSTVIKADAFHHRSDAISSVATFIGISIGIIGGKGYEEADNYAAIFAAALILYNAYKIARPAIGELLDETLEPELLIDIKKLAKSISGVEVVQQCKVRKMGTFYHVDLHIWVDKDFTVEKGHDIAHEVKKYTVKAFPQIMDVHIHVEPFYKENTFNIKGKHCLAKP